MTSWGLLYQAFRSAFPASDYRQGDALLAFELEKSGVTCRFERSGQIHADFLVGADGSRSLVREVLFPRVKPRYAGYVAWRGIVNEAQAGPELLKTFGDHFTFQQLSHSHILCYLIPGPNGETMPGERRLNWVWYWNVPETARKELIPRLTLAVDQRSGYLSGVGGSGGGVIFRKSSSDSVEYPARASARERIASGNRRLPSVPCGGRGKPSRRWC